MADISTAKIKELRDRTSAGILDCKKALVATEGDMEKAVTWLREKGIAKANKKAGAVAAEGITSYVVDGNKAVLFEVNCQTDFVSANEKFKALVDKIGQVLIKSNAKTAEQALNEKVGATDLNTMILQESGVLGEKITLRRIAVVEKNADQVFGVYKYMGGKISSIVLMNGGSEKVANDIAMHIIAAKAVCFGEALTDEFKEYQKQIVKNAKALCDALLEKGFDIVSGTTENHLMLVDLRPMKITGKEAEHLLDEVGITCNKNAIPNDPEKPFVTSGIRLGTAAVTTRGMKEDDMREIADLIYLTVSDFEKNKDGVIKRVNALCDKYKLYE